MNMERLLINEGDAGVSRFTHGGMALCILLGMSQRELLDAPDSFAESDSYNDAVQELSNVDTENECWQQEVEAAWRILELKLRPLSEVQTLLRGENRRCQKNRN